MEPPDLILQTSNLCRIFGGIQALNRVHLAVKRGSVTGLIGPNGSGKTTFFQVVSRTDRGGTGDVMFNGQSIMGRRAFQIYRMGLARIFQLSRVFPQLTVLENLLVANRRRHDLVQRQRHPGHSSASDPTPWYWVCPAGTDCVQSHERD